MQHTPTLKQRRSLEACLVSYSTAGCCSCVLFLGGVLLGFVPAELHSCFWTHAHTGTLTHIFHCVDRAVVDWLGRNIKSTVAFASQFGSDYLRVQAH